MGGGGGGGGAGARTCVLGESVVAEVKVLELCVDSERLGQPLGRLVREVISRQADPHQGAVLLKRVGHGSGPAVPEIVVGEVHLCRPHASTQENKSFTGSSYWKRGGGEETAPRLEGAS